MRISDWSSDVCSSDLVGGRPLHDRADPARGWRRLDCLRACRRQSRAVRDSCHEYLGRGMSGSVPADVQAVAKSWERSEEHTSELQSLMRISYAVFCLKKKKK